MPENSFNKDFIDEMTVLLNDDVELFLAELQSERRKSIRLNPFKFKEQHFNLMKAFNLEDTGLNNNTFFVDVYQPLGQFPYYHAGLYYPQEASASSVVELMDIRGDETILDACAAPGGKSTQILSHLSNGLLISNELSSKRVGALVENIHRFGAKNVVVTNNQLSAFENDSFDKILLDVPCSGESMINRFPELIKQYSSRNILRLQALQISLFETAIEKIKDQGTITYSTCTFNRFENEFVIEHILKHYDNVEIVSLPLNHLCTRGVHEVGQYCVRYYPHIFGQGHFIAQVKVNKSKQNKVSYHKSKTMVIDKHVHQLDYRVIDVSKLNVKVFGSIVHNESKIHYSTPLLIDAKTDIHLSLEEAYLYLNGQQLTKNSSLSGYCHVAIDQANLGFVKVVNQQLKNHYPKKFRNHFATMKK